MSNSSHPCKLFLLFAFVSALAACSTNPATGGKDFTLFMPESSENKIGAEEHEKIIAEFGVVDDAALQSYVDGILKRLTPHTERENVRYTITILDSPIVNAFALPGGFLYVSRGLLALANDEAELAAVIGHEIGHVTARHSASRVSRGAVVGLGASILGSVLNLPGAGQALGIGGQLYLSSYSRGQEHEADTLGVRYTKRAQYDPFAMSRFLRSLDLSKDLDQAIAKQSGEDQGPQVSYFSTHPVTAERVKRSAAIASGQGAQNRQEYLRQIKGLVYGDSPAQGYVSNGLFVHPELGFSFLAPSQMKLENGKSDVVLQSKRNKEFAVIFDMAKVSPGQKTADYLDRVWMKEKDAIKGSLSNTRVNGMDAATALYDVTINNKPFQLRLMAVRWANDMVYRFAVALPRGVSAADEELAKSITYSLKRLTTAQKRQYGPKRIQLRVASSGMTIADLAKTFPYDDGLNELRFKVLNGIESGQLLQAGRLYKVISQ